MPLSQLVTRDRAVLMDPEDLGRLILDDILRVDPQHRKRSTYVMLSVVGWLPRRTGGRVARADWEIRQEDPEAWEAVEEAWHWLERDGLIRSEHGTGRVELTRRGRERRERGAPAGPVPPGLEALARELHPNLAGARDAFRRADFEAAINRAAVALEDAVRSATNLTGHGESLFKEAFRKDGPLHNAQAPDSNEADGELALFSGFSKAIRNPAAHRSVDYSDPMQGIADVLLADKLMRLIERAARRNSQGK